MIQNEMFLVNVASSSRASESTVDNTYAVYPIEHNLVRVDTVSMI